jgi:hypothetical protein
MANQGQPSLYKRPAGELVTYEELPALFSDVQSPWNALWMAISRYNRQLEGAKITLVKGQGDVITKENESCFQELGDDDLTMDTGRLA